MDRTAGAQRSERQCMRERLRSLRTTNYLLVRTGVHGVGAPKELRLHHSERSTTTSWTSRHACTEIDAVVSRNPQLLAHECQWIPAL